MKSSSVRKSEHKSIAWTPYLVLLFSLLMTVISAYYVHSTSQAKDLVRFENAVESTQDNIQDRLETYINVLRGANGLFTAHPSVGYEEFHDYVAGLELQQRYPGIQGIGFSCRFSPKEKDQFLAAKRTSGDHTFKIWPATERDEYHSILYLEPLDRRNQAAIGFDMFTEPVRRAAMARARDTGLPAASGRVTLVQEIDLQKQAGFLIYLPVYRKGAPTNTISERQAALLGFVYSPFRMEDLLIGIFGRERQPRVDFEVYDGEQLSPENLLHSSLSFQNAHNRSDKPQFTATSQIKIAGRSWTLAFSSRPEFEAVSSRSLIPYTLLGGILISIVLFVATRSQAEARIVAERIADNLSESEEAMRLSEIRFRTLVEQSPLSTQILAPDGRLLRVNKAWERLWGVTLDQVGEYNVRKDPQLIAKGIMPYIEKVFAGEVATIPPILYDPNETIPGITGGEKVQRWVRAFAYPVKDENGAVREVVFIDEDVSELKKVEEERANLLARERAARAEAEAANRLKDDFLATVSHELRTPLTAILGWARLLRTGKFNDIDVQRALETIERNTKLQAQLIEDLLDISRIISNKLPLDVRLIEIRPIVEAVVDSSRPLADNKKIKLRMVIDTSSGQILGDATRLQQVLWNLISNAIKFTPAGGNIEVRLERVDSHVEIIVKDSGKGISADFLPYVFDRFRQADSSITRAHGGLGLGLAIARHLIELHGGTIEAESEGEEKGATFIVKLPLTIFSANTDSPEDKRSLGESNRSFEEMVRLNNIKVLVVEDELDTREIITLMLTSVGAEVRAVASAKQALEELLRWSAEVLIADIGLLGEDGYELIRKVRSGIVERHRNIPAIALTAYAKAEDRMRAFSAGFNMHLAKPVEPPELVMVVASLVGRVKKN
ncbi:MAG: CHASE domain-containing protein [Acidobacteriota bacterium]